jgi:hypothetical protein
MHYTKFGKKFLTQSQQSHQSLSLAQNKLW